MANGNISGIKNESVGYISREGQADIKFHRSDFDGTWERDSLMGKPVSFSSCQNENGKHLARNVRIVE